MNKEMTVYKIQLMVIHTQILSFFLLEQHKVQNISSSLIFTAGFYV